MTTIRTIPENYSEDHPDEDTKFNIDITKFCLEYRYEGVDYCIFKDDLKDFFSIYLLGLNAK